MNEYLIRRANIGDATGIYELVQDAFSSSYLSYTIYQAPQVIQYISELTVQPNLPNKHHIMVMQGTALIKGYYHAVAYPERFFLNYIAVAKPFAGQRLGNALLKHYENAGVSLGYSQFALDVFETNVEVLEWYKRHGYKAQSSSFLSHIAIIPTVQSPNMLICSQSEWENAHKEESEKGFSKITCQYKQGFITVGLINGNRCKLMQYDGISLDQALGTIITHFANSGRETVIVSTPISLAKQWKVTQEDCIIRLIKHV